jgi:LytS/YehU family sensor histidine kinase
LVENAFKHCSHYTDKKNEISIELQQKNGWLHLHVRNTTEDELPQEKETGGIGLKNVTRRLDLLFGNNYTLSTQRSRQRFTTKLEIPIV